MSGRKLLDPTTYDTHIHKNFVSLSLSLYIYIYVHVCVCVCVISREASISVSNEEIPHILWQSEVTTPKVLIIEYARPAPSTEL